MAGSPHVACCVVVFASTLPLFAHTGKILLQTTPAHLKAGLERCRREVTTIPGVLECKDEHFWTQAPGMLPHPAHAGCARWVFTHNMSARDAWSQATWWEAW